MSKFSKLHFYGFTYNVIHCFIQRVLEKVYNIEAKPPEALDPYSDDSKAPFYRQPAGIRKKKRSEEKEEAGKIDNFCHAHFCVSITW